MRLALRSLLRPAADRCLIAQAIAAARGGVGDSCYAPNHLQKPRSAASSNLSKIQSDGRERRLKKSGLGKIVETNDTDIVGDLQAILLQRLQHTKRHLIVRYEDSRNFPVTGHLLPSPITRC